jgi:prepilin-type N-terminal cleavage/methylation domain-containing protein
MFQKGFSLVELLVVVAIIGVLAGVGIVGYDRYVENTKRKVYDQNVATVLRAVDFEYTVVSNNLSSAMNEINTDGTATGNKISSDSNCGQFLYSVKEHFKDMNNPWFPSKKMITIDTQGQNFHKKGMLQLVCHRGGSFLNGWNCKIQDSLFHIIAYYDDGLANNASIRTDVNTLSGGNATSIATGKMVSEWFNRGYTNIPVADRYNASMPYMTVAAGQALCGTDGWSNAAIALSTDASY